MKKKIKSIFEMGFFLKKAGKIPGDIEVEEASREPSTVEEIHYNHKHFESNVIRDSSALTPDADTSACRWINIVGLRDATTVEKLGHNFNMHPLTLEDMINTDHLPKFESSENQLFFTMKFPYYHRNTDFLELRHPGTLLEIWLPCGSLRHGGHSSRHDILDAKERLDINVIVKVELTINYGL